MKKIFSFILMLILILSISACSKEQITMQEIYDASFLNTILSSHKNVNIKHTLNGELYAENYYSEDYHYTFAYDYATFMTDHAYYSYSENGYKRLLLLSPEGLTDLADCRAENSKIAMMGSESLNETIQSVTKKNDQITVTTILDPEYFETDEYIPEHTISCNCKYVLDATTHELISCKGIYDYDDGTCDEVDLEFFYDVEIPESVKAFWDIEKQTEDQRTITIVSNPGSENEKSQSVQVSKGLPVDLLSDYSTDQTFTMYADAACTELFAFSEDYNSDAVIYVTWSE